MAHCSAGKHGGFGIGPFVEAAEGGVVLLGGVEEFDFVGVLAEFE